MGTDCRILANGQLIGNGPFPITGTNSIAYNLLVAEDKRKEVKFDLTTEGKGHISLDVAIVNARRLVRQDEQRYLNRLGWEEIVWSTSESDAGCASIKVILQFRRPGRGLPEEESGLEEFLFDYNGDLQVRRVLSWPDNSSAPAVTQSASGAELIHDASAYLENGESYNENGQHELAIAEFNKAIQVGPDARVSVWNGGGVVVGIVVAVGTTTGV